MLLLFVSSASATPQPWLVTKHCRHARAPRLCEIHLNRHQANHLRRRMRQRPIAYHWLAERYPERRTRIMVYWAGTLAVTRRHWHHYQAVPWSAVWYAQAMCIHRNESTSWTEPGSPGGGMQFMLGTWLAWGGGRYAPAPSMASPQEQLRVAYRVVQHDGGWGQWSTAPMCGL